MELALNVGRYGATQMPKYSNLLATATDIQSAQQTQQMNALKMQKDLEAQQQAQKLNQLYGESATPTGIDLNRLIPRLAQSGMGAQIPEVMKAEAELEAKRLTGKKTQAETRKATIEADVKQLDLDLGAYDANVNSQEEHDRWLARIALRGDPIDAFPREFNPQVKQNILRMGLATKDRLTKQMAQLDLGGVKIVGAFDPTTGAFKESAVGVQAPKPPDVVAQELALKTAGAPRVTVGPQQDAELAERGKFLAKNYQDVANIEQQGKRTLPSLETARRLLDRGLDTGLDAQAKLQLARIGELFGMTNAAEFASNAQVFRAQAMDIVLQKQLLQKGPQTESDARRLEQTMFQLGNTPEANKFLIDIATAQIRQDIDRAQFYRDWFRSNRTYDGAEDAWEQGPGSKSLFERPELKKYTGARSERDQQALDWARSNPGDPRANEILRRLGETK
jgi:hypothetical protein